MHKLNISFNGSIGPLRATAPIFSAPGSQDGQNYIFSVEDYGGEMAQVKLKFSLETLMFERNLVESDGSPPRSRSYSPSPRSFGTSPRSKKLQQQAQTPVPTNLSPRQEAEARYDAALTQMLPRTRRQMQTAGGFEMFESSLGGSGPSGGTSLPAVLWPPPPVPSPSPPVSPRKPEVTTLPAVRVAMLAPEEEPLTGGRGYMIPRIGAAPRGTGRGRAL